MKVLFPALLWLCLIELGTTSVAHADDEVHYYERAKKNARGEARVVGTIQEETPGSIKIRIGGTLKEISVLDLVEIVYDAPGTVKLEYYRPALNRERAADTAAKEADRKKALEEAVSHYRKALPGLSQRRFAQRHVQYKIARLLARLAEDDSSQVGAALEALTHFKQDHPRSWQVSSCAKLLAELQLAKEDYEGAQKTYAELAALPGLPREISQECTLLVTQVLLRGKKYADAEARLRDILKKVPPEDPQAVRARVYLAVCSAAADKLDEAVRQLEGILATSTDNEVKAIAYNTLGDCYRLKNRPRDALWAYLWVDVIYHQNRREHAKAIAQLAKLFEELGDSARASQYQEKLKKDGK